MRADRLMSILLLLQQQERLTTEDLAARLEVSTRTIHRDMEALSSSGIPIVAERGRGGGWSLLEGYAEKIATLNRAEREALLLGTPARILSDLGWGQAAQSAFLKLSHALPAATPDIHNRIHIDIETWRQQTSERLEALPALQRAIWETRCIEVVYQKADGETVMRRLEPLGLVAKGSTWYLIAGAADEPRTYRVSRVVEVHLCAETFVRPAGFDLAAYWEESKKAFVAALPRYPAVLCVNAADVPLLRGWQYSHVEAVEAQTEHVVLVHMHFDSEEVALANVLSAGDKVEVCEPAHLREQVMAALRAMASRYGLSL
ncbi:MAG: YafY family protein [Anaerolineae bacterium]